MYVGRPCTCSPYRHLKIVDSALQSHPKLDDPLDRACLSRGLLALLSNIVAIDFGQSWHNSQFALNLLRLTEHLPLGFVTSLFHPILVVGLCFLRTQTPPEHSLGSGHKRPASSQFIKWEIANWQIGLTANMTLSIRHQPLTSYPGEL